MTPTADAGCWEPITALVRDATERLRQNPRTAWFRIGDALLEFVSDHDALLEQLDAFYGDCRDSPPASGDAGIRCLATVLPGSRLVCLSFEGPQVPDPLESARSAQRMVRRPQYVEVAGPMPGWRWLVRTEEENRFLIAGNGRTVLVNLEEADAEFVAECIVGVVQRAQTGVLFLHAASVGIAGAGALLIGPSRGGKSATALTLAWRGHAFLGDDVAAVRLAAQELLPFRKSAGLREGPLARVLCDRLPPARLEAAGIRRGQPRTLVRVSELFPASATGPLPLRFAFLLDGFADRTTITPYRAELLDVGRLRSVATETSSAWGISPARDLMNFLVVIDLLSRLRCYRLRLGPPEESAGFIEAAVEANRS